MSPTQNNERELYAETDAWNSPRIFLAGEGGIGIEVGGMVIVAPLKDWHHWAMFGRRVYQKEANTTQEESARSPLDHQPLPRSVIDRMVIDAAVKIWDEQHPSPVIPPAAPLQPEHQVPDGGDKSYDVGAL
jgi:hypothetical protein